ncbi:uncharacterized protein LOC130048213 [Ostrea edulis]|uniref:uncharacterized protein LOC130048213 n=1 Tax=Ostrea edulis TaxID=37623 RepID=UPI0024AF0E0D|nr:uncharacterized protein LOC130048213 [Ostrea edulis]
MEKFIALRCLAFFMIFSLIDRARGLSIKTTEPCQGANNMTVSMELQLNLVKLMEFSPKLRTISETLYKEHLTLALSLVKLIGLTATKVEEICRLQPSLIFPHPDECQLYYNCSVTYTDIPIHSEQHLQECRYPDVFSTQTLQCENFTAVCCGARKVLKDKCDYRRQLNISSTCKWQYPSCSGKTDGYHRGSQGSKSYINCFNERLMNIGMCEDDTFWDTYKTLYNGKCTNLFEIPQKDGGYLSSCEGKADGNYRFNYDASITAEGVMGQGNYFGIGRKCDAYYRCQRGVATAIKCPRGAVFESQSRTCKAGNHSIEFGCQLYCNPNFRLLNIFPYNLAECPYPEQFSEVTQRCENFTKVTCGSRPQVKDYCQYWVQLYFHRFDMGHCEGNHFSCAGLPDGLNEHPVKRGPNYVRCLQERLIEDGRCPMDTEWGTITFPYNGKCTHMFAIPESHHGIGLLPDCSGKSDGNYQYPHRPCDAYYRCDGGNATAVKCPSHTNFDVCSRRCRADVTCSG